MLSRVAQNVYWLGRYLERAESLARLVLAHQSELVDATSAGSLDLDWHPLLEATAMGDATSDEDVITYMVSSADNPDSVYNCVFQARENSRAVRDKISDEMWLHVNSLWLDLKQMSQDSSLASHERNDQICQTSIQSILAMRGLQATALPRGETYLFLELGSLLERVDKISRLVDLPHFIREKSSSATWNTMLRACDAMSEYREVYGGEVNGGNASSLLLFSTNFPKSVRFCVREIDENITAISTRRRGETFDEVERAIGLLSARLDYMAHEEVQAMGLHDYVDSLQVAFNEIGEAIERRYFYLTKKTSRMPVPRSIADNFQQ